VTNSANELSQGLITLLDALEDPVSIASTVRDREGRILDFRIEFVNLAAATQAGVSRETMLGRIIGELLPELRASGYFDVLHGVVETGVPYNHPDAELADAVTGGAWIGGRYDVQVIRLGDGYLSTWRVRAPSPPPG